MEPHDPPHAAEPDAEEPLEAVDYYEAMRGKYLISDADDDVGLDLTPFGPSTE